MGRGSERSSKPCCVSRDRQNAFLGKADLVSQLSAPRPDVRHQSPDPPSITGDSFATQAPAVFCHTAHRSEL